MVRQETKKRGAYSTELSSMGAVWSVLSHARKPMTVKELHTALVEGGGGAGAPVPSVSTLTKMMDDGIFMGEFFGTPLACADAPWVRNYYVKDGKLHLVLALSDGQELTVSQPLPEGLGGENISRDGLDRILRRFHDNNGHQTCRSMQCAAQTKAGPVAYEAEGRKNNVPRHYYLESPLRQEKWQLLEDMVYIYPFLTEDQTAEYLALFGRLGAQVSHRQPIAAQKRSPGKLFEVTAVLREAIQKRRCVHITYGEYSLYDDNGRPNIVDGKLSPGLFRKRSDRYPAEFDAAPYALLWSDGNYYLVCQRDGAVFHLRAERIMRAEMIGETFTYPKDFDPKRYRDRSPAMHYGQRDFVRMRCKLTVLSRLIDTFGDEAQFAAPKGNWVEVTVPNAALDGVFLFAMRFMNKVEVLEPKSLRKKLREAVDDAMAIYDDGEKDE